MWRCGTLLWCVHWQPWTQFFLIKPTSPGHSIPCSYPLGAHRLDGFFDISPMFDLQSRRSGWFCGSNVLGLSRWTQVQGRSIFMNPLWEAVYLTLDSCWTRVDEVVDDLHSRFIRMESGCIFVTEAFQSCGYWFQSSHRILPSDEAKRRSCKWSHKISGIFYASIGLSELNWHPPARQIWYLFSSD